MRNDAAMVDLDHVAIGVPDVQPPLRQLVGELGGTVVYGGDAPGCRWVTTRLGDAHEGMNLELLEPWRTEDDPFLKRFLEHQGPGPHHLTFIADDLDALLERLADAGLAPVKQRLGDPAWREAFLAPGHVGGTVVQLADSTNPMPITLVFERARCAEPEREKALRRQGWLPGTEGWWDWPGERGGTPAVLERVVLASHDLARSLEIFGDLLGGETVERTSDALELRWAGGRLRFELRTDRAPGILRLDCASLPADEIEVAGARLRRRG